MDGSEIRRRIYSCADGSDADSPACLHAQRAGSAVTAKQSRARTFPRALKPNFSVEGLTKALHIARCWGQGVSGVGKMRFSVLQHADGQMERRVYVLGTA